MEGVGDGVGEPGDADLEDGDVLEGEGDVGAGWRLTGAGGNGAGLVVAEDDPVKAAAVVGAEDGLGPLGVRFEAEILERGIVAVEEVAPFGNAGHEFQDAL